jgi:hypothetical protein
MASLFPIGAIANGSNSGTIDSISYTLFEPNAGCVPNRIYNILTTLFENKTMLARKKAEPYLSLTYNYNNIFSREYLQIEHFVDSIAEDGLNSFLAIDFSHGQTPSSISAVSSDWVVSIDNTRLYSTTANQKADNAVMWDGRGAFMLSDVVGLSANTSITMDVSNAAVTFGNLSLANAQTFGMLYPVYTVYLVSNSLSNFKTTDYWNENANTSEDGGYMFSGSLSFIGKFKI